MSKAFRSARTVRALATLKKKWDKRRGIPSARRQADLEPDDPRQDCPWKCAPDAPSCLCVRPLAMPVGRKPREGK
jgi:hypothetical protein